jgi:hypothetical protein
LKTNKSGYPAAFFACALNLAHRLLAAFAIFALAAADVTRFFTLTTSRSAELPKISIESGYAIILLANMDSPAAQPVSEFIGSRLPKK